MREVEGCMKRSREGAGEWRERALRGLREGRKELRKREGGKKRESE